MSDFTQGNKKCIFIGILTGLLPFCLLFIWQDLFWNNRNLQTFVTHCLVLQGIGSVLLIIGIFKNNFRFLIVWLISATLLGFELLFLSINSWGQVPSGNPGPIICVIVSYSIVGILIWSGPLIYNRFYEMRNFSYINLDIKPNQWGI